MEPFFQQRGFKVKNQVLYVTWYVGFHVTRWNRADC